MANHYAHFITNDDLYALYCYGITHVRVPVAYWMVLPDHSRLSACMPMHAYTLSWCIVALKARVIHPCHRTGRRASASTRSLPMASMPLPSGTAMAHSLRPAATYVPKRARAVDRARCSWPHGSVAAPEPGRTGSVCLRGRPDTTRAIQSGPRPWPSAVLVRASPGGMWRQFQKPTKFVYHDDTPTTWRSWGLQDENFVTGGIRSS